MRILLSLAIISIVSGFALVQVNADGRLSPYFVSAPQVPTECAVIVSAHGEALLLHEEMTLFGLAFADALRDSSLRFSLEHLSHDTRGVLDASARAVLAKCIEDRRISLRFNIGPEFPRRN